MKLSVAIIAKNEADRIHACLESAGFADEILVVDSGSTDETPAIAGHMGAKVIHQDWLGYARQKQFAVDACENDWVLILDADESVPRDTADAVLAFLKQEGEKASAVSFLRKNFFHGKWMKRCGFWPNRVVRLVNRKKGKMSESLVHESWIPEGNVFYSPYIIFHASFRNYADLIKKMQEYSSLSAKQMHLSGRTCSFVSPPGHGAWMFIRSYLLELGILAGFDGFVISLMNAMGSFMKYAKLYERIHYPKPDAPVFPPGKPSHETPDDQPLMNKNHNRDIS